MNQRPFLNLGGGLLCLAVILIGVVVWTGSVVAAPLAAPLAVDIGVTQTDAPDPILIGNRLTYSINVRNVGTARAQSVIMTDTLPASVIFASISTTKGVCTRTGNALRCTLGNLNKNANVRITVTVTPTVVGVITNTANIATTSSDNNLVNNVAMVTTTVAPRSDLIINLSDAPDPVLVGNLLTYTVGVSNAGPSNATNVFVTNTLPFNVTFNTASTDCTPSGNLVVCNVGSLSSGSSRTLTMTVTPGALAAGVLIDTATAKGSETDLILANNTASITTTVNPQSDLAVSQIAAPVPAFLGNPLVYTLTLINTGPSPASNIRLTDTLSAGATVASVPAGCTSTPGQVVCTLATLGSGASVFEKIVVTPTLVGSLTNTVVTSAAPFDPNLSNNTSANNLAVIPAADLAIVKTADPQIALVGDVVTYTLTVTNSGPSQAANVVITDALPLGILLKSVSTSQGSCSGTSLITCSAGTINNGGAATISIVITTTSPELLLNTAGVASIIADPNPANNVATRSVAVNPVDLIVSKGASASTIQSGDLLTYTIVVTNGGPLTGTNILLTDTLPANVAFNSISATQGSCSGMMVILCSLSTLNPGEVTTVTLAVTPTTTGLVANTASVNAAEPDPDPTNNAATATTAINPVDLALTKTASPEPVFAGDALTYTLVVTNNGPSSTASVIVTDELPSNVIFNSASPACFLAGSQVLCSAGTMPNGNQETFTVTVNTALAAGVITNSAVVDSAAPDANLSNNMALAATTILPKADLVVSLTDNPDPVYVGRPLAYVINLVNNGPAAASTVLFTQTLPSNVTVSTIPAGCAYGGGWLTCALIDLPAGAGLSLLVEVIPTASASSLITSTAMVKAAEYDPNAANNTATVSTTVIPVTDLSVIKTSRPDPAVSGSALIYTVVVSNAGPSNASGVLLTDTLPTGVTFNAVTPGCAQASGLVTCSLGGLASGLTRTIVITVTPQASTSGTLIENVVDVTGAQFDPDQSNNTYILDTAINPIDLAVTKAAAPNPAAVGSPLTYTLRVTNTGNIVGATGVFVYDTLPPSVIFRSATAGCLESGGLVTCSLPDLPAGATTSVTIVVTPTTVGSITNEALVDANEADNNPVNDTASVNTTVIGLIDLALSKTAQLTSVAPGKPITYTVMVTNTSQMFVAGIALSDSIPSSVINPAWTCAPLPGSVCAGSGTGQQLLSTLDLAAGGTAIYTITGQLDSAAREVVTNTATLLLPPNYVDANLSNNTATATIKLQSLLYLPLVRR